MYVVTCRRCGALVVRAAQIVGAEIRQLVRHLQARHALLVALDAHIPPPLGVLLESFTVERDTEPPSAA